MVTETSHHCSPRPNLTIAHDWSRSSTPVTHFISASYDLSCCLPWISSTYCLCHVHSKPLSTGTSPNLWLCSSSLQHRLSLGLDPLMNPFHYLPSPPPNKKHFIVMLAFCGHQLFPNSAGFYRPKIWCRYTWLYCSYLNFGKINFIMLSEKLTLSLCFNRVGGFTCIWAIQSWCLDTFTKIKNTDCPWRDRVL